MCYNESVKYIGKTILNKIEKTKGYKSPYINMTSASLDELFSYYNMINCDITHMICKDDICTPMECVKTMIDYIPDELWKRNSLKILDPCCGNGNFGGYCKFKTNLNNVWFNDINSMRLKNCKKILNPKNITNHDALTIKSYNQWDLIMANPPYSGGGNKNTSLSKNFIEHSIDLLKNGGYLCFVAPNNWMTFNNNNTTLKKLLALGSFLVIDNDVKKYFPGIGSSFTIFIWQKGVFSNKTLVKNNYLLKDTQYNIEIPSHLDFIPLYISQEVINIVGKCIQKSQNNFNYRCDLHNFTKAYALSDTQNQMFKYETIHTARKTRYAIFKQDIYDKWLIIVPLSTYYLPFVKTKVNVTQSVGYFSFDTEMEAKKYVAKITQPHYKLIVHLTRYGNFNNIMVLKHLKFDESISFSKTEILEIQKLNKKINY